MPGWLLILRSPEFLPTDCLLKLCIYLFACMCVNYLFIRKHVCAHVCVRVRVHYLHVTYWGQRTTSSILASYLVWVGSGLSWFFCQCAMYSRSTDRGGRGGFTGHSPVPDLTIRCWDYRHNTALPFMWALGIWAQVGMLAQQGFLYWARSLIHCCYQLSELASFIAVWHSHLKGGNLN